MAAILTNKSRFFNVENFISAVKNGDNMIYVFLAKGDSWPGEPATVTDSQQFTTPTPVKSVGRERIDSEDILCMKRVLYQDIQIITKYLVWQSGSYYDEYDDSIDLFDKNYYVVNSNNSVYKCIVKGSGTSTVAPTGTGSEGTIQLGDGYEWKFMYSLAGSDGSTWDWTSDIINIADESKPDWMPVKNIQAKDENPHQWEVMKNSIDGAIHQIKVLQGQTIPDGTVDLIKEDNSVWAGFTATSSSNVITITSAGSGIDKISKVKIGNDEVTDKVRIIHSPPGGHGRNAVKELMGCYIYLHTQIPADITWTSGEYRKIGIISNPLRTTRTDGEANKLTSVSITDEYVLGERINKEAPESSDYLVYSGDIVYVDNLDNVDGVDFPRLKTTNQIIDLRMILTF